MVYADDTQLYICFDPADRAKVLAIMEKCVGSVRMWAVNNKLALNDSKTELLHMTSKFRDAPEPVTLVVGDSEIPASRKARNLGAIIDSNLTMKPHIDRVCRSAMIAIHRIGQIREHLDNDATAKLVHAFVTSVLDSCNSLVYGLPDSYINRLQRVQNIAARLITRVPRCNHITDTLRTLHWLPVRQRTMYKILLLAYKTKHHLAPKYLTDLISPYKPKRNLRSANQSLLATTFCPSTIFYGDRTFAYAATDLWNQLPLRVRQAETISSFKSLLKTTLF